MNLQIKNIPIKYKAFRESDCPVFKRILIDDQILAAVGTGTTVSGFALEVGEQETYRSWEQFQQSIVLMEIKPQFIQDGSQVS
ncbi:MAG: hypothetical protein RMY29_027570 [Nostoc sp. CreGUA01]|nr:hypothetical protein [Nostoc sp. CreGUA01]